MVNEVIPKQIELLGNQINSANFSSHVVGTTFIKNSQELLRFLKSKASSSNILLKFVREPENSYDANAVRVEVSVKGSKTFSKIGYIPKDLAQTISYILNHEDRYTINVTNVSFYGGEGFKTNIGIFFNYKIIDSQCGKGISSTIECTSPTKDELDLFFK